MELIVMQGGKAQVAVNPLAIDTARWVEEGGGVLEVEYRAGYRMQRFRTDKIKAGNAAWRPATVESFSGLWGYATAAPPAA